MSGPLSEISSSSSSPTKDHLTEISTREDLIYVLSEASTLEHMIMCEYLFAAFSLKKSESEGLNSKNLEIVRKWEGVITNVAIQEMTHLALVNNMLVAIGSGPYFLHSNFPQPSRYFSPNISLALIPFSDRALKHFLYLERPEGMSIEGVPGFEVLGDLNPDELRAGISPQKQYFSTVGNLYRGIEEGFRTLSEKYGESGLFIGSKKAQATEDLFGLNGLVPVDGLSAATKAVEGIVEMGEGARGQWQNSHFGMFLGIFKEFVEIRREDPNFHPTKPVVAAYTRPPEGGANVPLILDEHTIKVAELFNANYSLAIETLSRFYVHETDRPTELQALANTAAGLMSSVIKPLGNALTNLRLGDHLPGLTAGPSFELQHREYILPHREQALAILHERLTELSDYSGKLSKEESSFSQVLSEQLKVVQDGLSYLAGGLSPIN